MKKHSKTICLAALMNSVEPAPQSKKMERICIEAFYIQGDFQDAATFQNLKERADNLINRTSKEPHEFFILPQRHVLSRSLQSIIQHKLCNRAAQDRIVVEKPFGTDLASAKKLNLF